VPEICGDTAQYPRVKNAAKIETFGYSECVGQTRVWWWAWTHGQSYDSINNFAALHTTLSSVTSLVSMMSVTAGNSGSSAPVFTRGEYVTICWSTFNTQQATFSLRRLYCEFLPQTGQLLRSTRGLNSNANTKARSRDVTMVTDLWRVSAKIDALRLHSLRWSWICLASGVAYTGGRTGEGRAQAAGADGRRAQTDYGRG